MGSKTHYFGEFKKSLRIVPKDSRRRIIRLTSLQCLMSFLDLLALAVVAGIGAIAIRGYSSQPVGTKVSALLNTLGLSSFDYEKQVSILLLIAVGFLTFKSLFSMAASRRILKILSSVSTELSLNALKSHFALSTNLDSREEVTQVHFSVTQGINSIVFGVIGTSVLIISDTFLLLLLCIGLIIIDPAIAVSAGILFSTVGVLVTRNNRGKAKSVGSNLARFHLDSQSLVRGIWNNSIEVRLRSTQSFFYKKFDSVRKNHEADFVDQGYLPNVGKYYGEITIIVGSICVAFSQFMLRDIAHAIASLGFFMAATSRIAPALLRIHQNSVQIQISLGTAQKTLDTTNFSPIDVDVVDNSRRDELLQPPGLQVSNLTFGYKPAMPILNEISIDVMPGDFISIVGPSGGGKTTLLNLMLGALEPLQGQVLIGNSSPINFARKYPGSISYVAQNIQVYDASLRENILLGLDELEFGDGIDSLINTTLLNHLGSSPLNVNNLSGGEKQRLGLARALVSKPKLLILDEPTSALDAQSESVISSLLSSLKGKTTIVLVAHRLSTVQQADKIYYLEKGQILGSGTFEVLRKMIPNFDTQAELMGF
jgi:ABC-type multidrug transport system fused ATPase/permease subunit